MKKFLLSILLLVYFVVSTGFVVSVHYCMDKVNSLQFGDATRHKCGNCGMPIKENNGCCKDEVKVLKMQVDQAIAKLVKADFSLLLIAFTSTQFLFTPLITEIIEEDSVAHGPPLSEQDTYLHNRVFRL